MAELRAVKPDEIELVAELYNNAYRIGMPTARGWVDGLPVDETIAMVEPGRVASVVRMLPYTVWVGGRELPMGGIGGVATWNDCQGQGYAGTLMTESVRLMRERGFSVSSLYPFSHRYYRKFGWESSGERLVLSEFTQGDLIRYEELHCVRACLTDADFERVAAVYGEFAVSLNGMAARGPENWTRRRNGLVDARGQAYLIEEAGRATGYFFCEHPAQPDGVIESRTTELACVTPGAWRALFGFLSTLPTVVKKITVSVPPSPPVLHHFKEPFFSIRRRPTFQFRVVDVEKALAERGIDSDVEGDVAIEIRDAQADWNTGVWKLAFGGGRCQARRTSGAKPDLSMSIQEFSTLFIGAVDPVAMARRGAFPAASATFAAILRLLRDAFHDRTPYLADAF